MRWSDKFRNLTQEAVKHGAAALSQSVPSQGRFHQLLQRLADDNREPVRTGIRVYEPGQLRPDGTRWNEAGGLARTRASHPPVLGVGSERLAVVAAPRPAPSGGASMRMASDARGASTSLAPAVAAATLEPAVPELAVGAVLAERYEIRRVLGHGPAFRVFLAHHRAWERNLALKVPRTDPSWLGAAPSDLTAAALRWTNLGLHPHIVYCHYVDRCDDRTLLVVEHRPGGSLRPWIASGRTANLRIGLNLAVQICHGLERAHAEGVWHGGLRPENLLFNADETLAVGDFGIAAGVTLVQAARDGAGAARMAELDPYVAPEQWVEPAAIDARTDVFALGVCLYEMLSGRRPYDIARGLRREPPDPCTPGRVLPSRLAELLRACVDWEPANRPSGMQEIRSELCAAHQQLFGRPSPFAELPRHGWDADGWNNHAMALLMLGRDDDADTAWSQALAVDPAHLEATYNAGMRRWSRAQTSDAAVFGAVNRAAERRGDDPIAATLLAELHLRNGDVDAALERLEVLGADTLDDEGRALLDRARRRRGSTAGPVQTWNGHRGYVTGVQIVDGAGRCLSAGDDGALALWVTGQAAPLRVLEGHRAPVGAIAASSDGRIALSGGDDAQLRMWELKSGRCLKTVAAADKVFALAANAELSRAVFACSSGGSFVGTDQTRLLAWDLERDRPLGELKGHAGAAKCVALSADGRLAASGGDDHSVRIWDVAQGGGCRRVLSGHQHYVSAMCLSAKGELAVSGSWDTTVRVWDTRSGRCLRVMQGHDGIVNALALSADARLLISGGWDRTVRVWDVATGRCLRTFAGHEGIVSCVALSADATLAASGSWDKTVRLWRLPPPADDHFTPRLSRRITYAQLPSGEPEPDELLDCAEAALRAQHLEDALAAVRAARTKAVGADAVRAAQLWAMLAPHCRQTGIRALSLRMRRTPAHRLDAAYPTRSGVVTAQRGGALGLCDLERDGAARTFDGHEARVLSVVLSDDERVAVSAGADRMLRVWDLQAGTCLHVLSGHSSVVTSVALDADARRALSGSYDHSLRLWDLERGRCERIFRGHARQVTAVAIDGEGSRAASGDYGGSIHVWDLAAGSSVRRFAAHGGTITALRMSADGMWLLSASADGSLRLWQMASGECTVLLERHAAPVLAADLSPDQRWALAAAADGAAQLWDLTTGQSAASFALEDGLESAHIQLDTGRIAAIGIGGDLLVWDIERELEV